MLSLLTVFIVVVNIMQEAHVMIYLSNRVYIILLADILLADILLADILPADKLQSDILLAEGSDIKALI